MTGFNYLIIYGGGEGPDVWDRETIISAVDIFDAVNQARGLAEESGAWLSEVVQCDHACTLPPTGWRCTRYKGHSGPCAAVPATRTIRELREENETLAKERDDLKMKCAEMEAERDVQAQSAWDQGARLHQIGAVIQEHRILTNPDWRITDETPRYPSILSDLLESLREQNEELRTQVRDGLAHWKEFYEAELDRSEKEAAQWKQEGDMYGWNFHTGKHSGLINCDIGLTKLKAIDAALSGKTDDGEEP